MNTKETVKTKVHKAKGLTGAKKQVSQFSKRTRNAARAARVKTVAKMFEVTERHVNNVLSGDRINQEIIDAFLQLEQGENLLLNAVKQSVKFN